MLYCSITVTYPGMTPLPDLDDQRIAIRLQQLRQEMSVLRMERESGISRQVLYRLMGGSQASRSPYELTVKVVRLLNTYYPEEKGFVKHSLHTVETT